MSMIRWVEPFAYKTGEPFRVMPIGEFKRGNRTLNITEADLREMAENYEAGRPRWKIPIYQGHPTAEQPDPPKVGNVARMFVRPGDGLYAVPEYNETGEKAIADGAYQFVSPGVLWSKNGGGYADEKGKVWNNVIEHVALTNRPYFGQATALFSADPAALAEAEALSDNSDAHLSAMRKAWKRAQEMMSGLMQLFDSDWVQDLPEHKRPGYRPPQPETASATTSTAVTYTVSGNTLAGGEVIVPASDAPAGAAPETMNDEGEAKGEYEYEGACNPHMLLGALESVAAMAETEKDNADLAGSLIAARDALKRAMAGMVARFSADDLERARQLGVLAGAADEFRDYDAAKRKAMAEKGEAMPDGSFPIADVADLKAAIQSIGRAGNPAEAKKHIKKRARDLEMDFLIPDNWSADVEPEATSATTVSDAAPAANSNEGVETMSDKPVTETFTAEEFAALKAQAAKAQALEAQVEALKTQAETMSAYVVNERKARRRDQLTRECEQFHALGVPAATLAEKFQALEEKDAELFAYFKGLLEHADTALVQAGLFGQRASARGEAAPESFEALVDKIQAEKFNGDVTKAAEALQIAAKMRPDLAAQYLRQ